MATDWRLELAKLGDNVDAQAIVDSMKKHGYTKQQIAKTLEAFMAETPNPDTGTGLTVEQFIAMVKDPSKIDELKQILAKMDGMALLDLKAQIMPLLTNPAKPDTSSDDQEYQKKLVAPVIQATNNINSIVSSQIPKRTKMLDIIEVLNSIIPTPALQIKDETGVTYADKILKILSQNTDKFGTIATPGDKFVKLLTPSIQTNNRITLPQTALESQLRQLKKAAGII